MGLAARPALRRRALSRGVGAVLCLGLLVAGAPTRGAGGEPAIAVIVGRGPVAATPLSQTLVLGIFGRKRLLWPDRSTILPVNLPASHPLRRNFSLWVFDKTPEDLQDYWNDQYFHGVLPPPVLASEEAVIRFVATTPGAIGYVSSCSVDRRVEVVAVIQGAEPAAACPR